MNDRQKWNAVKRVLNRAETFYTRFGTQVTHHHVPTLKKMNGNVSRMLRTWANIIGNEFPNHGTFNHNFNNAVRNSRLIRKYLSDAYKKIPTVNRELNLFNQRGSHARSVISRAVHQALSRPHFVSGTFVGRRARNTLNEATGTTRNRSPIRNVHKNKPYYRFSPSWQYRFH